ncbi:CheY-like superfamily [Penicillium chermesinum]|nr:CheY-like superfamily [Penicillium chermesinum]
MEATSKAQQKVSHATDRRVRELYRYYRPQSESLPAIPEWLSTDAEGVPPPSSVYNGTPPVTTPPLIDGTGSNTLVLGTSNNTLTAFAQLAAVRLGVERALICVLDRDKQFTLAEATPSLNLDDTSSYETKDSLWTGVTGSRKAWSLCQDTVALSRSDRENGSYPFLIVDDLSQNDRYKRFSFVEKDPHYRFFAGTPLMSDNNINLGCFLVLDSKPRDGLSALEKACLGGSRENNIAEQVSHSGSQDVVAPENISDAASNSQMHDRSSSNDARSIGSGGSDSKNDTGTSRVTGGSLPEWITNSSRNRLPPGDSQGNPWVFRRAANLLRESLDLSNDGGVAFLEAANTPLLDDVDTSGSDCAAEMSGPATVLSISTNEEPFSPSAGSMTSIPAGSLDRSFLSLLIRRYPRGKLWSFHRDGLISTSDDDDREPRDRSSPYPNRSPPGASTANLMKPLSKRRKAAENSMLNKYFPNATQLIFVPLWNAVNSQWFAGCFCWTTEETQVFSSAVDLSSVIGFGTSIMAEYSRIESLIADQQKGDFIGSISHELRSPLHGILAAAEFLHGTNLSEFQRNLIETVNSCGQTLLDTMNQVLDFSKVVSLERTWRSLKRKKEGSLDLKGDDKLASHLDSYVVTDLSILAEEVVEGICLGHAYGQNSATVLPPDLWSSSAKGTRSRSNVDVIIDVAYGDWVYRTQPGALRRIIMNLFGNAMKYTESGRVSLSLEAKSHSEGRTRRQGLEDLVVIQVADTGRGISEEFLRTKIYVPFAQENSLSVGTGLGLSIVRSLVKALHGNIKIRSRVGEGTVVRVSLPLARPVGLESPPMEPSDSHDAHNAPVKETQKTTMAIREKFPGKRVAIWGVDPAHLSENPEWVEIARYLTEWFSLEIVAWPPHGPIDILLVKEFDLPALRDTGLSAMLPALLILCHRAVDYSLASSEWEPYTSSVDIIRRPCGPHKLARSVLKCLQHGRSAVVTPTSVQHDPMDSLGSTLPIRSHTPPPIESAITSPVLSEFSPVQDTRSTPSSPRPLAPTEPSIVTAPPEEIAAAPLPPPLAESTTRVTRPARVLVVDDNRINLNLMMTFMKKRQLTELAAAENGKLAVEEVEKLPCGFDIIFMDISMPVMNGFEATRAIRSLEKDNGDRKPAIIIALTGLSSSRDESEALASGVDMFLTKPVSFREVARLLNEWERDGLEKERRANS